ncbi:F-box protein At5g07610-like [Miscanthus floridulus]|uniref:F-box protein At5g07610-like n=1 Tax=Miscanthus floridulus TaxID=154761 RepID=UPI00345A6F8C
MDRPARGGWNRRGGRGFGSPGPSGAAAGWTSSTGTTRSTPTPASSAEGDAASCSATLDNDDLLGQILLRLPPLPSSLPRAAAVCKRWRRLVADPGFLRRFRAHHGKAPLLGFFFYNRGKIGFTPVLDPPDPIPAADRLTLRLPRGSNIHGCRHGRVLIAYGNSFLVWDPVSGDQCHLPYPSASGGTKYAIDATISCAASATDQGHVHGSCHSSPYRVVFLGSHGEQIINYVYSSETGTWGDAISMTCMNPFDPDDFLSCYNTLVGNSIYWLLNERTISILEFDLDQQSLATIEVPPEVIDINPVVREESEFFIMPAEGCGLGGLLMIAGFSARIWKRKYSCDGNAGWVLINTIKLDNHLRLKSWAYTFPPVILGFAEDHNVVFLLTAGRVIFMVHLNSWQFKKLPDKKMYLLCYPFTSFCAAGPLSPVTSVPQVMSAMDSWSPLEAINGEPNSLVEVGVADRWDPMVLEASINATSVQNQRCLEFSSGCQDAGMPCRIVG